MHMRLQNTTRQPRVPDGGEDVPDAGFPGVDFESAAGQATTPLAPVISANDRPEGISEPFNRLLEQLARQHLVELAGTDPQRLDHAWGASVWPSASRPQVSPLSSGKSKNPIAPGTGTSSMTRIQNMRPMSSEEVLVAWERHSMDNLIAPGPEETSEEMDRTFLQRMEAFLQSPRFEMLITCLLCFNVLWMAFELQVEGSIVGTELGLYPPADEEWFPTRAIYFRVGDVFFTSLFCLDVVIRVSIMRAKFFKICMNYLDTVVSFASLTELVAIAFVLPVNPLLFRLIRLGKLARALRMVTISQVLSSLQLLTKCLAASIDMLFWTFCLLTFLQCVAGMVISTLCREFLNDPANDLAVRQEVFQYYGTFTRCFLTMFEILFANWSPPCRVLVENVSEWLSVFFLIYRCVLGFAVLNVVNSVFVQQTMRTASSDEELAFKQKEKDVAQYARKVSKLFAHMDDSGDGAINFEEFSKLVTSPKLKFWMSQLELEYHDLLSLFEFLDNGDGQITLQEFIEGAARLRGSAKALDVWRLETKVEVLFDEMLQKIRRESITEDTVNVQNVFEKSQFKHIRRTWQYGSSPQDAPSPAYAGSPVMGQGGKTGSQGKLTGSPVMGEGSN